MSKSIIAVVFLLYVFTCIYLNSSGLDQLELFNRKSTRLLTQLVNTKYFRLIRLNLASKCPLKHMSKICKSKSCSVCRCDEKDIPTFWAETDKAKGKKKKVDIWETERTHDVDVWHVEDIENDEGEYFDIHANVEAFTGYNGSYIWKLIYEENCFHIHSPFSHQNFCPQEQILYLLVSGLHSSISTQLCQFYHAPAQAKIEEFASEKDIKYQFNQTEYASRILSHPERILNLFFLYQLVEIAVKKISPYLASNFTVQSDNLLEDLQASKLLDDLLAMLYEYDLNDGEHEILQVIRKQSLNIKDIQHYIHNISRILNCVDCQKCKLFGKMQTYGVGTALKILLQDKKPVKRNQIVALFNTFTKLSMSIETYYIHRKEEILLPHMKRRRAVGLLFTYVVGGILFLSLILWLLKMWIQRQKQKRGDFKRVPKERVD